MTNEELYVWELVEAATALSTAAVPLAAALLVVNPEVVGDDTACRLLGLLATRADVSPSPAQEAMVGAWRDTLDLSKPGTTAQSSAHWQTLKALRMDQHAASALRFMHSIAMAHTRRWQRADPAP